ncbi:cell division protein FtsX [bacterium]
MNSLKHALKNIVRYSFISVDNMLIITLSIIFIASYFMMITNAEKVINKIKNKVEIVVFLEDDLGQESIAKLRKRINTFPNVKHISYVDKKEAFKEFIKDPIVREQVALINVNPLPSSFNIRLYNNDLNEINSVVDELNTMSGVEDIKYASTKLEKLNKFILYLYAAGIIIGVMFFLIINILVRYIAKLNAVHRVREIYVMKIFGATKFFLVKMFFWEGFITAIISISLGIGVIFSLYKFLKSHVWWVEFVPHDYLILIIVIGFVLTINTKFMVMKKCLKISRKFY